jgi:hypothetical protein
LDPFDQHIDQMGKGFLGSSDDFDFGHF